MVKKKTIFLLLIIVISLIAVSAVSAAEDNATDIVSIEETEDVILEENSNEDILNVENDDDELSEGVGSFSDLNYAINGNNLTVVELTQDYKYNSSTDKSFWEDGIVINRDMTIKGNGHYLDGNGYQSRIFATTHAVTFEDIHFKNAYGFYSGAIYGNENVTAINCNFTQVHGQTGGAMYKGTAIGCNFIENQADYGAAIYEGTAINCSFIKNQASEIGGAMHGGFAKNCTFIQNDADYQGGAVYECIAMFCNFTDNDAYEGEDMWGGVMIKCSPNAGTYGTIIDLPTINAPDSISTIMDSRGVLKYTIFVGQSEVTYVDATIKIYSGNRSNLIKTIHDSSGEWVIDLPANDSPYIADISADGFTADEVSVKTVMVYVNRIPSQILLNTTSINPGEEYVEPVLVDQWGNPLSFAEIQTFWRNHEDHSGVYVTDSDGKIRVPTGFLTSGSDLLIMIYSGNEKYASYRFSKFITVRGSVELIANNLSTIYGVEEYMNVTLVDSSNNRAIRNANVTVDIGGVKNQYVTDSSGKIRIPTKDVSAGNNAVEITFEATSNYMKSSITRMLNVETCNTTLSLEEVMTEYGINWDLLITLKDQFGNPMNNATIKINSNSGLPFLWSGVTNETGQAKAPVSEAPAGTYHLNVIFESVPEHAYIPNYNGASRWNYGMTVNFLPSTLTLNNPEKRDFHYSENASVEGVLLDHQGNPIANATISVDIDGVKNYTTDENGTFEFIIKDIAPGHHDVNITFNGNGKYTKSNYTWDINVIATPTELHASNVTTTYNVNQDLVITLTDYYDTPLSGFMVSVDLDGVSNYTTDENGQIIIPTKNMVANNYTAVITFAGNGNYTQSNTTAKVVIAKDTTQLSSTDLITVYRYEDTFNITLTDSFGNPLSGCMIYVDMYGIRNYTTDENGMVAVHIYDVAANNYTAAITFEGNENYTGSNTTSSVKILKGNSHVIGWYGVHDYVVDYDSEEYMKVLVEGFDIVDEDPYYYYGVIGNATLSVDFGRAAKDLTTDEDGILLIPLKGLNANFYNVLVSFAGNENYTASNRTLKVTVNPIKSPMNVTINTTDNNVTFTVDNIHEKATGFVKFEITGPEDYVLYMDVVDGKAVLEDVLSAGEYAAVITYLGDTNFLASNMTKTFTVTGHVKKDTAISSVASVEDYTVTITTDVDANATGYVTIAILGQTFIVPVDNGNAVFSYDFTPGTYNANVTYLGDDNFNNASCEVSFTVTQKDIELKNTTISVDVESVENDVTITANIDPKASGLVEFNIAGKAVYVAVVNGKAVYTTNLPAGDYNVVVTYLGDSKYNANRTSVDFTVTDHIKKNTTITSDVVVDGYDVEVTVNVDVEASGFVEFTLNNTSVYAKVSDGKAVFDTILLPGEYAIKATYLGDDDFNANTTDILFTVEEIPLNNTPVTADVELNENNVTITVNVDSAATGFVKFNITGAEDYVLYAEVVDGKAVLEDVLSAGEYTAYITYMGDGKFNSNSTVETFAVTGHIKKNTTITSDVVVDGYDVTVTVNVDENAVGFVKFTLNGNDVFAEVVDGKAVMNMMLPAGNYTIVASYLGDDDFNANATDIAVTVEDIPLNDTAIDVDVVLNENNVTITVSVDPAATGLVKFNITGVENYVLYAEVVDGKAVLEDVLTAGDYTAYITYIGDSKFNSNSTVETFTVTGHIKKDTAITAVPNVDKYTVTIETTVDANATGYVTIGVLGQTFIVPVNDGKAIFEYDFTPGIYSAAVTYLGDDNFNSATTTTSFTVINEGVVLKNTTISLDVTSVENNVTIIATVNSSASGLVEFNIEGNVVYIAVSNGNAVYNVALPAGDYNVVATYLGDGKFSSNKTSQEFTVTDHIKKNTTITSDVVVDGYDVTVTVNVDANATGFVKFTVKGDNVFAEVIDGKAVMNIMLPAGNYTIAASYLGDDDFNANSTDIAVKVEGIALKDTPIDVETVVNENNVTITVSIDSAATGLVKFNITGAENYVLYVEANAGKAVLEDVLMAGDYNVVVTYMGDGIYNSNSTTDAFTIVGHIKKDTELTTVTNVDGTTVSIVASVDENATGYVTISVLGQTFIVPVNNGKAEFSYDFAPGTYSANVAYLGDDNYNNASGTVSFTVVDQKVDLKNTTIDVDVKVDKDSVTITVTVDSSASGLVEFNIGGQAIYLAVNNGKAVYNTILPIGNYSVDVTYLGDDKFNSNRTTATFEVAENSSDKNVTPELLKTVIFASSVTTTYNGNGYVTLTIKDENGQFVKSSSVSISIAGKTKTVKTNAQGVAKLSTNGINPGTYNVIIVFMGDKTYAQSNTVTVLVVKKAASKITAKKKTFKKAKKVKKYAITLKSGKKAIKKVQVTLKIKGKTFKAKTNAKGKAVFKIKKLSKKGKFTATIKFKGNKYYKAVTKKVKITIK